MQSKPGITYFALALLFFLLALKFKVLLLPAAILIAAVGLTYVYSRKRKE